MESSPKPKILPFLVDGPIRLLIEHPRSKQIHLQSRSRAFLTKSFKLRAAFRRTSGNTRTKVSYHHCRWAGSGTATRRVRTVWKGNNASNILLVREQRYGKSHILLTLLMENTWKEPLIAVYSRPAVPKSALEIRGR